MIISELKYYNNLWNRNQLVLGNKKTCKGSSDLFMDKYYIFLKIHKILKLSMLTFKSKGLSKEEIKITHNFISRYSL